MAFTGRGLLAVLSGHWTVVVSVHWQARVTAFKTRISGHRRNKQCLSDLSFLDTNLLKMAWAVSHSAAIPCHTIIVKAELYFNTRVHLATAWSRDVNRAKRLIKSSQEGGAVTLQSLHPLQRLLHQPHSHPQHPARTPCSTDIRPLPHNLHRMLQSHRRHSSQE